MVVNPFARELTFLDDRTRTRREHLKYPALIRASALLHQHHRSRKKSSTGGKRSSTSRCSRTWRLRIASRTKVLGRSLDELPPHRRVGP
jgi:hypothetical protein